MVVGYGDHNGINGFVHFLQQFPVIPVEFCLGKVSGLPLKVILIHVAQGHQVGAALGDVIAVAVAFATHADAGDANAFIGAQDISQVRQGCGQGEGLCAGS